MNFRTINLGDTVDTGYVTADECAFGYTFVNGECLPVPMTIENPQPVYSEVPKPPIPAPTYPSPAAACPNGMTLYNNAVCLPDSSPTIQQQSRPATTTIIPGVPNWMVYGIGGVAALVMLKSAGGRR